MNYRLNRKKKWFFSISYFYSIIKLIEKNFFLEKFFISIFNALVKTKALKNEKAKLRLFG